MPQDQTASTPDNNAEHSTGALTATSSTPAQAVLDTPAGEATIPADPDALAMTSAAPNDKPVSGHESRAAEVASSRRATGQEFETTLERVRLDQIDGLDEDLQKFLREHDVLTEVGVSPDRWAPQILRLRVQRLHLTLWRRAGRLVHIGSGRSLTLARRIARHDDYLAATIIQAKSLSLKQKLTVMSEDILLESALHRPAPGHAEATFRLWQALTEAGVEPIKGKEPRHFALAMGLSPATVKARRQPKRQPD